MIDPRTTNIVGAHVRLVKRIDPSNIQGRGVVRVVDYNQGAFALLIEAIGAIGDGSWFSANDGELFQVSLFDESIAVLSKTIQGARVRLRCWHLRRSLAASGRGRRSPAIR